MERPVEGPGLIPVDNETNSEKTRITKSGKTITYKLNVIQQPERARACGSGAKSSADRRPVDPPAIVELTIFESDADGVQTDVTFRMNANYLLFATLDQARHMARGRVQQDQARPVVLTGSPVAGMVYLDRPHPAGYFIFPDLSVRHEGNYRLTFALFEESKDPRDEDAEPKLAALANGSYLAHRLDVRSEPFTVYSAKKFPGLTESTTLSRIVADQGCRVRIRRDVRMRRRDNKTTKEWDDYENETSELRARHSATPEAAGYTPHAYMEPIPRPRSGSNASHISVGPPASRRPSLPDVNPAYGQPSYGVAPQTPQNAHAQSSPFIAGPSPSHPHAQPPFMHQQQQSSMQPPPPTYHQQSHQHVAPLPPAPAAPHGYYNYSHAPPPPVFESSLHPQRHSMDWSPHVQSDRRSSGLYPPPPTLHYPSSQASHGYSSHPPPPPSYHQSPSYPMYSSHHHHQSSVTSSDAYIKPAPAEPIQPPTRTSGAHTPLSARTFSDKLPPLPPINTAFSIAPSNKIEPASPISAPAPSSHFTAPRHPIDHSHKRGFGETFSERHLVAPLRHGARPSASGHSYGGYGNGSSALDNISIAADGDAMDADLGELENQMVYRRADGRQVNRSLPAHD